MLKRNENGGFDRVEAATPTPPAPTGETLIELDRGKNGTLRLALDEFNGSKYVNLSMWNLDGWPTKGRTLSFRLRELPAIVEVLGQVAETMTQEDPRDRPQPHRNLSQAPRDSERPVFRDRQRRPAIVEPARRETFPTPRSSREPFDETGQGENCVR